MEHVHVPARAIPIRQPPQFSHSGSVFCPRIMKILFLCHRFPYPPDHGARIRAFYFIRHLSQTHSVTVATLAHSRQEVVEGQGLKEFCHDVIAEVVPSRVRWLRALQALISSEPSSVAYFRSPALQGRIGESLNAEQFDVIIVFCAFMAQYVLHWRQGYRILDYGDIDWESGRIIRATNACLSRGGMVWKRENSESTNVA